MENTGRSVKVIWDMDKRSNIYVNGFPEGKERESGGEVKFKNRIAKNDPTDKNILTYSFKEPQAE